MPGVQSIALGDGELARLGRSGTKLLRQISEIVPGEPWQWFGLP